MIPSFFNQIRPVQRRKSFCSHALGVAILLSSLLASAEAAVRLQANQYTEVARNQTSEGFVFTVPDNSIAALRVTELGCPGNVFNVTSGGSDLLFRTSSVPSRLFCRNPYRIASASDAFADPTYSKGSIELASGTYTVHVVPQSRISTSAAIGFFIERPPVVSTLGGSTICTVPVVTETEVISLTSTVVSFTPSATPDSQITPSAEDNFEVITVTAEASTRIVTVAENCETSMASSYTTEIEPSTTVAPETTSSSAESTSTTDISTVETTFTSEPEPTTSEISATTTVEPETSTAVASETSTVVTASTSAEVTETTTSEFPTSTDVTPSTTAEPSSTTETVPPSATTDVPTSTHTVPTPAVICTGGNRYLKVVTSRSYLFSDAEEACGVNYHMARLSTFKEIKDGIQVLLNCGVKQAWIKVNSANTIEPPKCYAVTDDKVYEPDNCEQAVMQVLCSTP